MTRHSQYSLRRFCRNKKAYSGIVATIFMVLVVLFLVFNVQMYMRDRDSDLHNTLGQAQQLDIDRTNEQLTITNQEIHGAEGQVTISCALNNTSPLSIKIVRLWVQDTTTQMANSTPILEVALQPGQVISFTETVNVFGADEEHSFNFWFITSRGNALSPFAFSSREGPPGQPGADGQAGPQGPAGSFHIEYVKFRYYDFGTSPPNDNTVLPAATSGCDIPQGHYVMVSAELTNHDPENRAITLTADTYVWGVDPKNGADGLSTVLSWPIAQVQDGVYRSSFVAQELPIGTTTIVYFFDPSHPTPVGLENPVSLNMNLYGSADGSSYGQNVPFVSLRFISIMKQAEFRVNPDGAGSVTPSGVNQYHEGSSVQIAAFSKGDYRFSSWSSNTESLTVANPSQPTTTATVGASGTITANFIATPPHFIDTNYQVHDSSITGQCINFPAMQTDLGSDYSTLKEMPVTAWKTPSAIGTWKGDIWVPGEDSFHNASYTIDGNAETYWSCNRDVEHYICFDLGQTHTITKISIYQDPNTPQNRWGYGSECEIDVYIWPYDNQDIFTKGYVTTWTDAANSGGWVTLTFLSPREGRYIKLWEHNAADESRQRMYEFKFEYQCQELSLEGQFVNVDQYQYYNKLNIQTKSFSASGESLSIYYWNNGVWTFLDNLKENYLNVFTVTLTGPNFDIKFKGNNDTFDDIHQSSWQIDYCSLTAK